MHLRRHKDWFEELQPGLNLTPLLDVLFNLIFFFILATTIKESQAFLNVSLPYSEQAQETQKKPPSSLVIVVNDDNEILIQNSKVAINTLGDELKEMKKTGQIQQVLIRGDANAYHQTIVSVLDACAEAGLYKVSVEVIPKEQ